MLDEIKSRISDIEKAIQESVVNYNGLLARLDEAKFMLDMAAKVVHVVAPDSCVDKALSKADQVVENLCEISEHV